ncbi:CD302 antigen [Paramormyrops kingsleyae]|uniref:CD302 molecule n=1 Tax=Paramormyrops kingsleyae TaxID=1676925 RepID=A0A3B3RDK3_9TELE|nr:CD302 antigen [Paramormyrops kingsleyae]
MGSRRRCRPSFLCKLVAFALCCSCCFGGECPADGRMWVPFGNSCYHFVHGEEEDVFKSYSIERAKDLCHGYGLLTVNSKEENMFVIKYSSEVWKGNRNVWLGIYYDSESEELVWQTEEHLDFTNWGKYSDDLVSMDTCGALNASSGMWDLVSCEETSENGVVCETLQEPEKPKKSNSWLLSALVILSVVVILGISAVIWFMQQRHSFGPVLFTAFEYHPPFRALSPDEACLMEVEETGPLP